MSRRRYMSCSKCGKPRPDYSWRNSFFRRMIEIVQENFKSGRTRSTQRLLEEALEEWGRLQAPIYSDLTLLFDTRASECEHVWFGDSDTGMNVCIKCPAIQDPHSEPEE